MKISKTLSSILAVAAIAATASFAPAASAEVSASAGVANMYLWRGYDLGDGSAAISGDLNVSGSGFYAGIWGSSGDSGLGSEYDLYTGWGGEFGMFTVDISVWTYVYPDGSRQESLFVETDAPATGTASGVTTRDDTVGDLSEAILSVGVGPVAVTYYNNIAGLSGYTYYTIGAEFGAFSVLAGQHHNDGGKNDDPAHLDLSYAYNDNLSFTVSKIVSDELTGDDNMNFVVSYSLDIK